MIVGFAGSGNMAGAIARGLARATPAAEPMLFADSGSGRAETLAAELGGERVAAVEQLAERADVVFLAVKPAALEAVGPRLRGAGAVVSVLGATPLVRLNAALGPTPVLRALPNLAVEIGRGVVCHAPAPAGAPALDAALELLAGLGSVVELPEDELDAATAVMGCAPAYIALAAGALADAGADAGLDAALSARLVREAIEGVGRHLASREPGPMQAAIASPGGSTEAGLAVLDDRHVAAAFAAAVEASLQRMAGVG